jgi:HNH/ENDO VII superfamily nuclease
MGDSHTEGLKKGQFCSLREPTCPCGNTYQDIMKGTESWGKYPQRHRVLIAVERSPEAHHVLPVASVTGEVTANKNIKKEVVENTKWCVNDLANMIALPLFEMAFLHYLIQDKAGPPPFDGLPMHNYDHAKFQKEVGDELKKVGKDAQQNTKAHEKVSAELLAAMNANRDFFKPELESRGKRGKGTHGEFVAAMDADEGDTSAEKWYIPFSMADDPSPKPFPSAARKTGLSKKLADLKSAWEAFCAL